MVFLSNSTICSALTRNIFLLNTEKESSRQLTVSSVPMGLGAGPPPYILEGPTKSRTFLLVFTPELLWITLKSQGP